MCKIGVGDLNLGTVGNRKHTYFYVWPNRQQPIGTAVATDVPNRNFKVILQMVLSIIFIFDNFLHL